MMDWDRVIDELKAGWIKWDLATDDGCCLLGALYRTEVGLRSELYAARIVLRDIASANYPDRVSEPKTVNFKDEVAQFNDHPDTTLDDVILVCEKARANDS